MIKNFYVTIIVIYHLRINNKSLELADFGYEMSKWKTLVNPEIEKLEKNVEQISKKRKLE